jgi:hypothetical protein
MTTTLRDLIEGPHGAILRPGDLVRGLDIVVFDGDVTWTGDRFLIPVGARSRFRLADLGTVAVRCDPYVQVLQYDSAATGRRCSLDLSLGFALTQGLYGRYFSLTDPFLVGLP